MGLEDKIHKHFNPKKYAEMINEYRYDHPQEYQTLNKALKYSQDPRTDINTREIWLNVLYNGIISYYDTMTDDQYEMWSNLYLCAEEQVYKQ